MNEGLARRVLPVERVVLVQSILAPYRIDLFNRLASTRDIDLKVLFCFRNRGLQQWSFDEISSRIRFPYDILDSKPITAGGRATNAGVRLYMRLVKDRPALVVSGGLSILTVSALLYAKLHRVPVIVWWAGTPRTEASIHWGKGMLRRLLVSQVARFICYSEAAGAYLALLGVTPDKVDVAGNVTFDAAEYRKRVASHREEALRWRERRGWSRLRLVLAVGQLSPRKNHALLFRILSSIQKDEPNIGLLVVGDGPLRSELEQLGHSLGIRNLYFSGHIEPERLFMYYAAADVFVHLSLMDHWSQAANEAMASALPVIISREDHATELIEDGRNGFVVDVRDPQDIASKIRHLLRSPRSCQAMGERAFETVASRDVRFSSTVFLESIRKALTS